MAASPSGTIKMSRTLKMQCRHGREEKEKGDGLRAAASHTLLAAFLVHFYVDYVMVSSFEFHAADFIPHADSFRRMPRQCRRGFRQFSVHTLSRQISTIILLTFRLISILVGHQH